MKSSEDGITELTINACQSTRTCNYQLVDWNTTKTDDIMHIFYGEIPKHVQYILKNNCLQCMYAFKAIKSEEKNIR